MTSASELFYTRRSRYGRGAPDLGFDRNSDTRRLNLNSHGRLHYFYNQLHRQDSDGCNSLRRSPQARHHVEHASVRLDQGTSQLVSSNGTNRQNLSRTSRPRLSENDRLPGAVLLARERLLERLRGVPLSDRRSVQASSGIQRSELMLGDDIRLDDVADRGARISTGQSAQGSPIVDVTSRIERLQLLQEPKKKPPGLTQEALDCLHLEVFRGRDIVEGVVSKASQDCSICLETFVEGDALIRLPCGHRFHSACLDPWIRTCGDCPYCRRDVVLTSHRAIKRM